MKVLFVSHSILLLSFVGVSLSLPYTNKPEEFDIHIFEKGLNYEQHVEMDEAAQIVTVYVPGHKDVDETYFITDLQTHLTMKVVPGQDVCLLMRNDPGELPPVDVWKKTREFTKDNVLTDIKDIIVRQTSYVMTEAVTEREWATFPRKMREICGRRSAVWTEVVSGEHEQHEKGQEFIIHRNSTGEDDSTRFKRDFDLYGIHYRPWLISPPIDDQCSPSNTGQKCVVFENSCFWVMTCETVINQYGMETAFCRKQKHIFNDVRCCKACCTRDVPDNNPTPPCKNLTKKEQICPRMRYQG